MRPDPKEPRWLGTPLPQPAPARPAAPPPGQAPGRTVYFYPQGTYFTSDYISNNIRAECGDWYVVVLKDQLARGVIDDNTVINVPGVFSGPLGVLRQAKGF